MGHKRHFKRRRKKKKSKEMPVARKNGIKSRYSKISECGT